MNIEKKEARRKEKYIFEKKCHSLLLLKCMFDARREIELYKRSYIKVDFYHSDDHFISLRDNNTCSKTIEEYICSSYKDLQKEHKDYSFFKIIKSLESNSKKVPYKELIKFLDKEKLHFNENKFINVMAVNKEDIISTHIFLIYLYIEEGHTDHKICDISLIKNYNKFIKSL